jgi:hypothetical protein
MLKQDVIAFCGRKGSGKTELSKVCEEFGYQKVSFATSLKKLTAQLIGVSSIEEVNNLKTTVNDYIFGEREWQLISDTALIPYGTVRKMLEGITLPTSRDVLQYVGTDIIRKYNENWHVKETLKGLKVGTKYVFDDVRFQNEKNALMNVGADFFFVLRPTLYGVSNHISETSIKWQEIDIRICNNCDLSEFKWRFNDFLTFGVKDAVEARKRLVDAFNERYSERAERDDVILHSNLAKSLFIDKDELNYEEDKFDYSTVLDIKETEYGCAFVETLQGKQYVENQFVIEDLKLYSC